MNNPQPNSSDSAVAAVMAYLRAGYSVIPVSPDKRPSELLPGRSWAEYQRRRATPQECHRWFTLGATGFAIICGPLSGVYGLDGDDPGFNQWLLTSGRADRLIKNTWTVMTCCDGPHIYLRSKIPVLSQTLKSGNLKVADIRGAGQGQAGPSYLVAPPTYGRCPKHGREGYYRTLYGDPEHVMEVENAIAIYSVLAEGYARDSGIGGRASSVSGDGPVRPDQPSSPDIPAPLPDEAKKALEKRVRDSKLSRKIKRALLTGAVAGAGDWKEVGNDNSDVDFAIACALLRNNFSEADIIGCFSTLHAGDFTFKNAGRPQHGLRYLNDYTLPGARKAVADSNAAAQTANGLNFVVVDHLYVPYDEVPSYHMKIRTNSGQEIEVKLKDADFESDRRWCRAVWSQSRPQFMPELQTAHMGANGFRLFMGVLGKMGRVEDDLPEGASESGFLATTILNMLRSTNIQHGTPDAQANFMGWIQDDWVVVRSDMLITRVKGALGRVTAPQVFQAFSKLGGHAEPMKIGTRTEQVWIIPVSAVGFES